MTFWFLVLSWALDLNSSPQFEHVVKTTVPSEAVLLDRQGSPLHTLRLRSQVRRLRWTELADIAPVLVDVLLEREDHRFRFHRGWDPLAVAHALWNRLRGEPLRGASTLTMQVASHIDPRLKRRSRKRSWWQKAIQVGVATQLERRWTKDQILEAYLNLTPFRGELSGIGAASQGLFQKAPHGLSPFEARLLVSLIPSPNAPLEEVVRRTCPDRHCRDAVDSILSRSYHIPRPEQWAPHVARKLLGKTERQVRSTLDRSLQALALQKVEEQLFQLRQANAQDAAVLIADNATGEVLAYVGSPGQGSSRPHVDGVTARRQAGSTLKAFLYGLAFEQNWLTPQTRIWDLPLEIPIGRGVYRPMNHDRQFRGGITARQALASSLNVPAVRVLQMVGVSVFHQRLRDLGISGLRSWDHYGPSLALGSAEVSLWELVNGFRTLANGGEWSPLVLRRGIALHAKTKRVFSRSAAYLVGEILSDRSARQLTFGLENTLSTRSWAAVKTGTSKGMRDNWCVGYSDRYTIGVWVGNFPGESMWNVVGTDGAAPIWKAIFTDLHREVPSRRPPAPPGIGVSSGGAYAQHTPHGSVLSRPSVSPSIRSPSEGTRFAWDPDIPPRQQRIVFQMEGAEAGWRWVLNGKDLDTGDPLYLWDPKPGNHRLALRSPTGRIDQTISFEVVGFPP